MFWTPVVALSSLVGGLILIILIGNIISGIDGDSAVARAFELENWSVMKYVDTVQAKTV